MSFSQLTLSNTNNGGGSPVIGTTQPTTPGLWIDNGVLTFWNGTTNNVIDSDDGDVTDAFGVDTGIDV